MNYISLFWNIVGRNSGDSCSCCLKEMIHRFTQLCFYIIGPKLAGNDHMTLGLQKWNPQGSGHVVRMFPTANGGCYCYYYVTTWNKGVYFPNNYTMLH